MVFFVSFPLAGGWRKIPCLFASGYPDLSWVTLRCNIRKCVIITINEEYQSFKDSLFTILYHIFGNFSLYFFSRFDIAGRLVKRFDGPTAGPAYVDVRDGTDSRGAQVASGVYLYQVQAGRYRDVKKMVLLK